MSKLKSVLIVLALIALVLVIIWPGVSGLGARFGLWDFRQGFKMTGEYWPILRYISMGLGGLVLLASALVQPRKVMGFIIGAAALAVPFLVKMQADSYTTKARSAPAIHDITTDTQDPPMFTDALIAERDKQGAANPVNYVGKTTLQRRGDPTSEILVSEVQAGAYPDITSITLNKAPAEAYQDAMAAVKSLGWDVFTDDASSGIIEATDTTFWYGFKDDIVVRVRPSEGGSIIDARSVSRIGFGDMGANAKRIRAFQDKLN